MQAENLFEPVLQRTVHGIDEHAEHRIQLGSTRILRTWPVPAQLEQLHRVFLVDGHRSHPVISHHLKWLMLVACGQACYLSA